MRRQSREKRLSGQTRLADDRHGSGVLFAASLLQLLPIMLFVLLTLIRFNKALLY